ncbi:MAG: MotA/TolQ/ExbB proton channel family protein [Bacteroides sp.]|nr:MotA/TolQ/ExbB proton channel family protein [Bacteroides sp.]MBD5418634.1 MotA/TolQ/ExbB proton channel family protein [Bacteroides sp.]MDE7462958.1 MotA/TolQ/ExbB proton channel family protein [Muribaculaceae bacterium]
METLSFWSLVMDGGYIMIPLAILLLLTVYVFTERTIAINKALREDPTFMKRIRDYVLDADLESAETLCKKTDTPYARLIFKGIQRIGRPTQDVLAAIENTGNLEVANLGKGLPWLSTTAAGAPMLGFLGTVVGMIQAFFTLAKAGSASNISLLSGGIYQALVTTVAGLVVGIIALFAYNYLVARIGRVMNRLEARSIEFMDLLNEPA